MNPKRKCVFADDKGFHKIEEFIWNSKPVVYINNRISLLSYDQAVNEASMAAREALKRTEEGK